jgi:hypothetical protein
VKRCERRGALHQALSVCLLASILLTGCASSPTVSIEEQVGNRSLQWVTALIALDYDEALTFMTPTYQSSPRAARFRGDFSGASYWQGAEIKWVKCDDQSSSSDVTNDIKGEVDAEPSSKTIASADGDECVLDIWNDCGQVTNAPFSTSSTAATSSERCEVRLILTVMKPPEMSLPMPIPYEMTWLKVDGDWYLYRQ